MTGEIPGALVSMGYDEHGGNYDPVLDPDHPDRRNGHAPAQVANPWPAPLADEAFHGIAGDVVRAILPHTEADPAALLVSFLAAFGSAVGRGAHVMAGDAEHGPNLFSLIVGETSTGRKGTSWNAIRRVMRIAAPDWNATGGVASGEGVIHHVRDARDVRRKPKNAEERKSVDDEGMVIVREDEGVVDKRLFLLESEFARLLSVAERRDNTTSAVLRQLWDSGDARSLAKNSQEQATDAHVTLVGHITPGELKTRLADGEVINGFGNRFLFVCSKRSKLLPDGDSVPDNVVRDLGDLVAEAFTIARVVTRVELDPDARELWREDYERLSTPPTGMLGAVLARGTAHVLRLALIYALLDSRPMITAEHLKASMAVWAYCERSAGYLFKDSTGDMVADMIIDALRHGSMNRREIYEHLHGNYGRDRVDAALTLLLARSLARCEREDTGGRPAERWYAIEAQ
jgi:hypothetical protein